MFIAMIYISIIDNISDYTSKKNNVDNIDNIGNIDNIENVGHVICQIHNSEMTIENVHKGYGIPTNNWRAYRTYADARAELFPNCDDPVPAYSCIVEEECYVKSYVCYECNNDRAQWIRDNRQSRIKE